MPLSIVSQSFVSTYSVCMVSLGTLRVNWSVWIDGAVYACNCHRMAIPASSPLIYEIRTAHFITHPTNLFPGVASSLPIRTTTRAASRSFSGPSRLLARKLRHSVIGLFVSFRRLGRLVGRHVARTIAINMNSIRPAVVPNGDMFLRIVGVRVPPPA